MELQVAENGGINEFRFKRKAYEYLHNHSIILNLQSPLRIMLRGL